MPAYQLLGPLGNNERPRKWDARLGRPVEALALLRGAPYPSAAVFDFKSGTVYVREGGVETFLGDMNDFFTYASPSAKPVRGPDGFLTSGTMMRVHHDIYGNPLGLLLEPQRTNLYTQSTDFTVGPGSAGWSKIYVTLEAGSRDGPRGPMTMTKVTTDGGTAFPRVQQTTTPATTNPHTFSYDLAAGSTDFAHGTFSTAGSANTARWIADLANGTAFVSFDNGFGATVAIEPSHASGVWRVSFTVNTNVITTAGASSFFGPTATYSGYSADLGDYIYGDEAQMEEGSHASSPILTGASQVTRAKDVISAALSSLPYDTTKGTLVVFGRMLNPAPTGASNVLAALTTGLGSNAIAIAQYQAAPTSVRGRIVTGASIVADPNAVVGINTRFGAAMSYAANDVRAAFNGVLATPDTSAVIPDLTGGDLLLDPNTGAFLLEAIIYVPDTMDNALLQDLSSR